jgi:hypothetical protein
MKVYLFSDYLNAIHGEPLQDSQSICEIATIHSFPDCLALIDGRLARVCMMSERDDYICIEFMGEIPELNEVNCSTNITCPHCGHEDRDSWEASDSDDARECGSCNSVFSYEREVEVTYSSRITERNSYILPLT